jgi:ribosomal protein S18 acetylase RimI-like enzyme
MFNFNKIEKLFNNKELDIGTIRKINLFGKDKDMFNGLRDMFKKLDTELSLLVPYTFNNKKRIDKEFFKGCDVWVGEDEDKLTGFLVGRGDIKVSNLYSIIDLLVDTKYRSKGLGSRLINASIEYSKQAGFNFMSIFAHSNNTNALRLYDMYGFKESGKELLKKV